MATFNFVLQGKGGVGKSYISSILAQYYQRQGQPLVCIDTDPVNATFTGYESFGVQSLDIMDGDNIDPRRFDLLMETLLVQPEDTQVVVDNGAATFVPLGAYLAENKAMDLLQSSGHYVRLHSVITGGQAMSDTLVGMQTLIKNFPGVPIVAWLNTFFGAIENRGKSFEEFAIYKEFQSHFESLVWLPKFSASTFGKDIEAMLSRRLTFAEASSCGDFGIMTRQRLTMVWNAIQTELLKAQL